MNQIGKLGYIYYKLPSGETVKRAYWGKSGYRAEIKTMESKGGTLTKHTKMTPSGTEKKTGKKVVSKPVEEPEVIVETDPSVPPGKVPGLYETETGKQLQQETKDRYDIDIGTVPLTEPRYSTPGTTATPRELQTVKHSKGGIITKDKPSEILGVSAVSQETIQKEREAAGYRAGYRAEERKEEIVQRFEEKHQPIAQQIATDTYNQLMYQKAMDLGMTYDEGTDTYYYTSESQMEAFEKYHDIASEQAQQKANIYYQQKASEELSGEKLEGVYREEYGKEGLVLVEKDGQYQIISKKDYERQKQIQLEKQAIESRMAGEEGVTGHLLEFGRFWYTGFTPENLLYSGTVGEIIFGGKDKKENILESYAQNIVKVNEQGIAGAFIEPYKPGGFGFIGTTAALMSGAGLYIGKAGGVATGTIGKVLRGYSKISPYIFKGAIATTTGAEIGYTKALEDAGMLPKGTTGKKIIESGTELALYSMFIDVAAGKRVLPKKQTEIRAFTQEGKLEGIAKRTYLEIGKTRVYVGQPKVVGKAKYGKLTYWGEPLTTGKAKTTDIIPKIKSKDPIVKIIDTGLISGKKVRTGFEIDFKEYKGVQYKQKEDIISWKQTPPELRKPAVKIKTGKELDVTTYQGVKPTKTKPKIIDFMDTPLEKKKPATKIYTGKEKDITTYQGMKEYKKTEKLIDFGMTPPSKRKPFTYQQLVKKTKPLDWDKHYENYVRKTIVSKALSTKVLPKPKIFEPELKFFSYLETGALPFEKTPLVKIVSKPKKGKIITAKQIFDKTEKELDMKFSSQGDKTQTILLQPEVKTKQKTKVKTVQETQTIKDMLTETKVKQVAEYEKLFKPRLLQKTVLETKTKPETKKALKVEPHLLFRKDTETAFMSKQVSISSSILKSMMKQDLKVDLVQKSISVQALEQTPVLITESIPIQVQLSAQMQKTFFETKTKTKTKVKVKTKLPDLEHKLLESITGTGKTGYDVFVKKRQFRNGKRIRGTEWVKLNKKPLNRNDALKLGSHKVDNTAKGSFKIRPSESEGKPVKLRKKVKPWDMQMLEYNFKGNDYYTEKAAHRIDSPGELQEITMKGIQSRRGRGSRVSSFEKRINRINRRVRI